jgi:hypothetical protein
VTLAFELALVKFLTGGQLRALLPIYLGSINFDLSRMQAIDFDFALVAQWYC